MELLTSYYNDLFLPDLSCVKLNDMTGESSLFKKIFHCVAAISTLQNLKRENQSEAGVGAVLYQGVKAI